MAQYKICKICELNKNLEEFPKRKISKDGIFELNKSWDIDHIIPLSSATCEIEVLRLNNTPTYNHCVLT